MFVRPGPDKTPAQKVSFATRVGDLGCGVGYLQVDRSQPTISGALYFSASVSHLRHPTLLTRDEARRIAANIASCRSCYGRCEGW